jgi:hypothetical protein
LELTTMNTIFFLFLGGAMVLVAALARQRYAYTIGSGGGG